LADQAYAQAIRLGGETVIQILDDQGYSLMLRGNLSGARKKFRKAILSIRASGHLGNLELLIGRRRFIERPPKISLN
jgi:Flp pilus assembly protein TadD